MAGFNGVALTLVMILAGTLGQFYQSPLAAGLTQRLAFAFLFDTLALVPASLLLKRFKFALHEGLQMIVQLIGITSYFVILFVLDRSGFKAVLTMALQIILPESLRTRFLTIHARSLTHQ